MAHSATQSPRGALYLPRARSLTPPSIVPAPPLRTSSVAAAPSSGDAHDTAPAAAACARARRTGDNIHVGTVGAPLLSPRGCAAQPSAEPQCGSSAATILSGGSNAAGDVAGRPNPYSLDRAADEAAAGVLEAARRPASAPEPAPAAAGVVPPTRRSGRRCGLTRQGSGGRGGAGALGSGSDDASEGASSDDDDDDGDGEASGEREPAPQAAAAAMSFVGRRPRSLRAPRRRRAAAPGNVAGDAGGGADTAAAPAGRLPPKGRARVRAAAAQVVWSGGRSLALPPAGPTA